MGWTYTYGATRESTVAELIQDDDGQKTIRHSLRGNVLWSVREYQRDGKTVRYIACFLLSGDRRGAYGYKDMCESMGPNEVSCPLSFFDLVPEPAGEYGAAWRERVRAFHAAQAAKRNVRNALTVGQTVELVQGCKPPRVTIVSLKPLVGEFNGCRYKVAPRHIPHTRVTE